MPVRTFSSDLGPYFCKGGGPPLLHNSQSVKLPQKLFFFKGFLRKKNGAVKTLNCSKLFSFFWNFPDGDAAFFVHPPSLITRETTNLVLYLSIHSVRICLVFLRRHWPRQWLFITSPNTFTKQKRPSNAD